MTLPPVQRTQSSPHTRAQLKVVEAAIRAVDAGQATTTLDEQGDNAAPAASVAPSDDPSDVGDPRGGIANRHCL
jgi:hypothetical protein